MTPVRSLHPIVWACLGFIVNCGAGGQALSPLGPTCPAGRTLLDGVCVSEGVADYVACVRAQGAQIGGERGQRVYAEVGTMGVKAGAATELRENLEKKYSVSDAATLEIVRNCGSVRRPAEAGGHASTRAPSGNGTGYELFWNGKRVGHEPEWGVHQAYENCRWNLMNQSDRIVECRFHGPFADFSASQNARGYELYWDGSRAGAEPEWSMEQAVDNCRWNLASNPSKRIECVFNGRRFFAYAP